MFCLINPNSLSLYTESLIKEFPAPLSFKQKKYPVLSFRKKSSPLNPFMAHCSGATSASSVYRHRPASLTVVIIVVGHGQGMQATYCVFVNLLRC